MEVVEGLESMWSDMETEWRWNEHPLSIEGEHLWSCISFSGGWMGSQGLPSSYVITLVSFAFAALPPSIQRASATWCPATRPICLSGWLGTTSGDRLHAGPGTNGLGLR